MNYERFKAIIEARGAHPARWPDSERAAAQAFAAANPEQAEPLLASERALDSALRLALDAPVSDILYARVMRAAPSSMARWDAGLGVALAASLIMGVFLGLGGARSVEADQEAGAVLAEALGAEIAFVEGGG